MRGLFSCVALAACHCSGFHRVLPGLSALLLALVECPWLAVGQNTHELSTALAGPRSPAAAVRARCPAPISKGVAETTFFMAALVQHSHAPWCICMRAHRDIHMPCGHFAAAVKGEGRVQKKIRITHLLIELVPRSPLTVKCCCHRVILGNVWRGGSAPGVDVCPRT